MWIVCGEIFSTMNILIIISTLFCTQVSTLLCRQRPFTVAVVSPIFHSHSVKTDLYGLTACVITWENLGDNCLLCLNASYAHALLLRSLVYTMLVNKNSSTYVHGAQSMYMEKV